MLRIALIPAILTFGGCSNLTKNRSSLADDSARTVVEKLFVERLDNSTTFQYFHLWNLDAVKSFFDTPLLSEYINFKKNYNHRINYLAKQGWIKKFGLGSFPIFARADPLTECSKKPLKIKVSTVSETQTSATYTVKYVQFGNHAKYSSIRTVNLVKKNNKWLLAWISTKTHDGDSETTSTFVSQLKFLTEKLYSETAN